MRRTSPWAFAIALTLSTTSQLAALDLNEVLARVDQSSEISEAELELEIALRQAELAAIAGDLSFAFQPSATAITPADGLFADQIRFSGSASVLIPVALTETAAAALSRAREGVDDAALELDAARAAARYRLTVLYMDAWLTQEEQGVIQSELNVAREIVTTNERLYEGGLISLSELSGSIDEVMTLETAALENSRDVRIRWLELAYAANLDVSLVTPALEPPSLPLAALPQPPELEAGAVAADRTSRALATRIQEIEEELAAVPGFDLIQNVRASFSAASHNVSATYNPVSELLSGSYSFPIYTLGETAPTSGSSSTESWEIGISISLGYETDRAADLERQTLFAELALARAQLGFQRELVALQLRQKYQQYLLAEGTVDQAQQSVTLAAENLELVQARFDSDLTTLVDVIQAEVRVSRAEYQLLAARTKSDQAALAVAEYADYLGAIWLQTEEE